MYAIKIENLEKKYNKFLALRGINLSIKKGKIFGLLGPNGAGKTTLIKALVGALKQTGGRIEILGSDPLIDRYKVRKKIGYMPQVPALYEDLSAWENIRFFGNIQNVDNLHAKIAAILEFTELSERAHDQVYTFSGGMKKRVSLACALIHEPEIIFLDEPTAAVDPHLKVKTWQLFRKLAERGITIFVSTHLMDEALLCDQLAVIYQGSIIALDAPEKLMQLGNTHVSIKSANQTTIKKVDGYPEDLAHLLQQYGLDKNIDAITITHDSLEHIILELLKRNIDHE